VRALLAPTGLAGIDLLPVSAISGTGMEALRAALAAAAEKIRTRGQQGRQFRYAIDRVFSVAGSGTVVTGTVFNCAVTAGDKLMLTPAGSKYACAGYRRTARLRTRLPPASAAR